jgi:hypothetical protein
MKIKGYNATQEPDGTLVVHDVPIFLECERNGIEFDREWIDKAVERAKQSERDGYFPPLHVRHHELSNDVRPAGFFRITGVERVPFKGETKLAILADLVITDPTVRGEVLSKRLPYRSVEIYDVDKPGIDSLALLDHEAPYLELPMLAISNILGVDTGFADSVASATFSNPWALGRVDSDERMVALFQRGRSAHYLTQDPRRGEKMADKDDDEKDDEKDSESMSVDAPPFAESDSDDEAGESPAAPKEPETESLNVEAVVKAIVSGSISVAAMDEILEAVVKQKSRSGAPTPQPAAPAPVPGAEAMSKDTRKAALDVAKLQGRIDALEAKLRERDNNDKRRDDVAVALQRLEGRPLGANLKEKLAKFHADHGALAFKEYVDSLVTTFGAAPIDYTRAAYFAGQSVSAKLSKAVRRYQNHGADALEKAIKFSREWETLHETGGTRMDEERYVDLNMNKLGIEPGADAGAA